MDHIQMHDFLAKYASVRKLTNTEEVPICVYVCMCLYICENKKFL